MAKHSERDLRGRFTRSGAPIPNVDGSGADPIEYDGPVQDGNHPYPEFSQAYSTREVPGLSYDSSHGGYHWRIPQRSQTLINGDTGEIRTEVPEYDIRALIPHERTAAHLAAAAGDPFAQNLMGYAQPDFHGGSHQHMGSSEEYANDGSTHQAFPSSLEFNPRQRSRTE
jgi:hypothetical protein